MSVRSGSGIGGPPGFRAYHGDRFRRRDAPLIWAHRGASGDAPENTLRAFLLAEEQGADGIECDVRLCATGEVVVVHDEGLERLAGLPVPVRELPLAELRRRRILAASFPGADEAIPTLEEAVLATGPSMRWNVELKVERHREAEPLAAAVVAAIRRLGIEERVLLSSFHPHALLTARTLAPHLATAYLWEPDGPFGKRWHGFWQRLCANAAVHPHVRAATRGAVERWHRLGYAVNAWVANEEGEIRRLDEVGVDGIITDLPSFARRVLRSV